MRDRIQADERTRLVRVHASQPGATPQARDNMDHAVDILAVAPYEGLAAILEREAATYPNVRMTIVVGNLEKGLAAAIEQLVEPYDLILSRGGTADLLRESLDIPVVDIKTSAYDVLQALQLSEDITGKRAVVGFSAITDAARGTSDALHLDLDIFTLVDEEDATQIVPILESKGYETILCDVISSYVFREHGFNTVLVTSGSTSVRESIDEAVRTARHVGNAHAENVFLRDVIRNSGVDTVIFNADGSLFFSTLDRGGNKALLSMVRALIPEALRGEADAVRKTVGGHPYLIKSFVSSGQVDAKVTFFLARSGSQSASRNAGIATFTKAEALDEYLGSPYSLTGDVNATAKTLQMALASGRPLLITGEYGTGRTAVAAYAYTISRRAARPLIEIDCGMLTDRSRDYLLNGRTSPLFESDLTIHIKNMEASDRAFVTELFSSLASSNAMHRIGLIFSCDPRGELVGTYIPYIKDKFQCIQVELPPLRENRERIPTIARLYLSQLNADLPKEVLRIDRQAMALLTEYTWPGNYVQFKRLLMQLCVISRDHTIRASDVRGLLALERPVYPDLTESGDRYGIDLDRPLAQIERDIVELVVQRNGGNQSAAARQLGISRTTLWRMTKSAGERQEG